jgi:hypothetical protein
MPHFNVFQRFQYLCLVSLMFTSPTFAQVGWGETVSGVVTSGDHHSVSGAKVTVLGEDGFQRTQTSGANPMPTERILGSVSNLSRVRRGRMAGATRAPDRTQPNPKAALEWGHGNPPASLTVWSETLGRAASVVGKDTDSDTK